MKKYLAAVLALMLLAGLVLCVPAALAETNPDWPTIRIIARKLGEGDPDNPILPLLEQAIECNIEIDWRAPSDYGQQCQVILASGDYPDMMEVWWTNPPGDFDDFAYSGSILALDDLIAEYGQDILKVRPDDTWWRYSEDDKIYAIPARYAEMEDETFLIRQDWLDNLNLEMPKTLDELEEVIRQFTVSDPDGNGKDDTYGVGMAVGYETDKLWLGAYGVARGQWNIQDDGSLIWWGVMPEAFEAILRVRELYQAGYIEPEYPLMKRSEMIEGMSQNKYGMQWWQPTQMTVSTSDYWREFTQNVPQAKIAVLPPITAEGVEAPVYPGVAALQFINQIIFTNSKHPEKCVQLLNYLATPEGSELAAFGIKGEHWDEVDGQVVTREMTTEEYKKSGAGLYAWMCRPGYYLRNTDPLAMEAIETYHPYIVRNPMPYATEIEIKKGTALKTDLTNSVFTKLIVEEDIDPKAVWDEYVEKWNSTGGKEMTEQVKEEYQKLLGSK